MQPNWRDADRVFDALPSAEKWLTIERQVVIGMERGGVRGQSDDFPFETLIAALQELGFWPEGAPVQVERIP